jgi:outer membrane protein assembly factor BamD (BamD/ComL family)
MATHWGVRGYPTLILIAPDGSEVDRVAGYAPPEDFIQIIEDYIAGRGTLDDFLARFEAHPDSLELLVQIGDKYQYRGKDSLAEMHYKNFLTIDPKNESGFAPEVIHRLGRVAYSAKAYDTAVARFVTLIDTYPDSDMAEDAATWVPYILAKQEKFDEALLRYEEFLKTYPDSPETDWVKDQIQGIRDRQS